MRTLSMLALCGGLALAGPALAQDAAVPGGLKVDTSKPIEINADSLEVLQKEQVAIFAGKVDVIQGEVRLRTEKLVVAYSGGGGDGTGGNIRDLTATGGVTITTGTESAQGDQARYDVVGKVITMTGSVILAQGENVIKGNELTIDLASGRSKITGNVGAGGTGRVKSIFTVPGKDAETQ